jgi:hypothetical protein
LRRRSICTNWRAGSLSGIGNPSLCMKAYFTGGHAFPFQSHAAFSATVDVFLAH